MLPRSWKLLCATALALLDCRPHVQASVPVPVPLPTCAQTVDKVWNFFGHGWKVPDATRNLRIAQCELMPADVERRRCVAAANSQDAMIACFSKPR